MKEKPFRYFVGDFETTVYKGQTATEVWASALVEMFTEDVKIFHSIQETFEYFLSLDCNLCVYYHNLKFDGAFWLSYLLTELQFKQSVTHLSDNEYDVKFTQENEMENNSFKYIISDMGQWYSITIKVRSHYIELRDSLKLLPFSVKRIGDSFKTKHKKLDMEYTGFRYAGCTITEEEQKYIANDVLVVKEALEIMYEEGHKKLTIGTCCLEEFKKTHDKQDYKYMFPDLTEIEIDPEVYGSSNADEYIRKSYKGGWCYLVKGKENQVKHTGVTADVNSLYPSMMTSESGNYYPIGKPHFWRGDIPYIALNKYTFFFVRLRTRFYIKKNMLPCIQMKGNLHYKSTEWLETSDIYNPKDGKYYSEYIGLDGEVHKASVELTLTQTDYYLIKEHYDLVDCEILDGCWFNTDIGIFDEYIEKYKKIKLESKGALRELAKLFLNNLYGKFASSPNSSFKYAYVDDNGTVGYVQVIEFDKKVGYIPIGSAITSYARNFTIRAAQKNYYGKDKRGFIYADTDSIHCDLLPEDVQGITVHPKNFCCWKLEATWDVAIFARQKTYVEHIVAEDLEPIETPYYNIKCAGMPEKCKQLFKYSMEGISDEDFSKLNEEEQKFVSTKRELTDFTIGLKVPSKLMPKRIKGGIVLVDTTYEMR